MKALLRLTAAVVIPVLFAGCASTKLTGIWVEPERPLPEVNKVLVIAVARKVVNRQIVEHKFVEAFQAHGVEAIASIDIMSPEQKLEKEEVKAAIEGRGIDTVIVTHLLGIDTEIRQAPATAVVVSSSYYGYYHSAALVAYRPGAIDAFDTILLETRLFNVSQEKLIWSSRSETFDPESVEVLSSGLTGAVLKRLAKDGLLER